MILSRWWDGQVDGLYPWLQDALGLGLRRDWGHWGILFVESFMLHKLILLRHLLKSRGRMNRRMGLRTAEPESASLTSSSPPKCRCEWPQDPGHGFMNGHEAGVAGQG